jgi:hypothetical protein
MDLRNKYTLTAALALAVAACREVAAPPAASVARDSAGVRVVENARAADETGAAWSLGEAVVDVGGGPEGDFFNVVGGALLPDGGFAVGVGGLAQVRFYDAPGGLRATLGGPGDGPEEFRLMGALGGVGGDTVWVYDYGAARLSLLTPADGFVRSVTLTPPLGAGMVLGKRADGSVIVAQMWGTPGGTEAEGLVRDPAVYARYGPDGVLLDTIGLFPGREVLHRLEDGRMTMVAVPFARVASHALLGDDLVVGDQVRREIAIVAVDGANTTLIRWAGPSLGITAHDVEAWKEGVLTSAAESERPSLRAYLSEIPFPDVRPAYGRILTDAEGAIWVADPTFPGEDARAWQVFDAGGRWLGAVRVPERFRLLDVGRDRVLGVARDELDVERIEVRRLERPVA